MRGWIACIMALVGTILVSLFSTLFRTRKRQRWKGRKTLLLTLHILRTSYSTVFLEYSSIRFDRPYGKVSDVSHSPPRDLSCAGVSVSPLVQKKRKGKGREKNDNLPGKGNCIPRYKVSICWTTCGRNS